MAARPAESEWNNLLAGIPRGIVDCQRALFENLALRGAAPQPASRPCGGGFSSGKARPPPGVARAITDPAAMRAAGLERLKAAGCLPAPSRPAPTNANDLSLGRSCWKPAAVSLSAEAAAELKLQEQLQHQVMETAAAAARPRVLGQPGDQALVVIAGRGQVGASARRPRGGASRNLEAAMAPCGAAGVRSDIWVEVDEEAARERTRRSGASFSSFSSSGPFNKVPHRSIEAGGPYGHDSVPVQPWPAQQPKLANSPPPSNVWGADLLTVTRSSSLAVAAAAADIVPMPFLFQHMAASFWDNFCQTIDLPPWCSALPCMQVQAAGKRSKRRSIGEVEMVDDIIMDIDGDADRIAVLRQRGICRPSCGRGNSASQAHGRYPAGPKAARIESIEDATPDCWAEAEDHRFIPPLPSGKGQAPGIPRSGISFTQTQRTFRSGGA
mmetsp:Transcript_81163/g.180498  ORF Transcript_81163/g.180498 Transcript_81163/m.180498 type:complete len:440 (+) Transcript_81163:83-1402(+)